MSILKGLPYQDRLGNDIYTDFRNMLRLEDVLVNITLSESEKTIGTLTLLYGDSIPEDIVSAHGELVWFYRCGQTTELPKGSIGKLLDFEEDSNHIIGSFFSEYHIDLTDADLYLHWWLFMALLTDLPGETSVVKKILERSGVTRRTAALRVAKELPKLWH